jgi:hypothetical protein
MPCLPIIQQVAIGPVEEEMIVVSIMVCEEKID